MVHKIASLSINSKADGVIPDWKTAETASQAFSEQLKDTNKPQNILQI